jgi:uncharacterized membrane-anchored protein
MTTTRKDQEFNASTLFQSIRSQLRVSIDISRAKAGTNAFADLYGMLPIYGVSSAWKGCIAIACRTSVQAVSSLMMVSRTQLPSMLTADFDHDVLKKEGVNDGG